MQCEVAFQLPDGIMAVWRFADEVQGRTSRGGGLKGCRTTCFAVLTGISPLAQHAVELGTGSIQSRAAAAALELPIGTEP